MQKLILFALWLAFLLYAAVLAKPIPGSVIDCRKAQPQIRVRSSVTKRNMPSMCAASRIPPKAKISVQR